MGDVDVTAVGAEGVETPFIESNIFASETDQKECLDYVCKELLDVRDGGERKSLEELWRKHRRQRKARPEKEKRDTPWVNAANIEPPLTEQIVHTIWAKEIGAFVGRKPLVQIDAVSHNVADDAKAKVLQKFVMRMVLDADGLNWKKNWNRTCYNQVSLGTAVVKTPFLMDSYRYKRLTGGAVEDVVQVRHQGPAYVEVRLEDFFIHPYYKDIDRAPWVGVRYRLFAHELKQKAAIGFYNLEAVDLALGQSIEKYDEGIESDLNSSKVSAQALSTELANREVEVYEVNVFWDIDKDGIPEDIILHIEPESQALLRAEYNPLPFRDLEPVVYIDDPDVFWGIGACAMCDSCQEEVTALHRMRLDGTQLSMLKVFLVRTGCGFAAEDVLQPMKVIEVDEPDKDVKVLEFPDIAQSCIIGETIAKDYAARVTGVSDNMMGFNDKTVGTSATVGGTMFLTQQGNSILNAVLEQAVQAATKVIRKAFFQCVANKENVDLSWMTPEEQTVMTEILSTEFSQIPERFRFSVSITDFSKSDEARKQNFLAATTVYNQYGQQAVGMLTAMMNPQLANNPQLQELFASLYVGQTKLVEQLFDFLEIGDASAFLPFTLDTELQLAMKDQQRAAQVAAVKEQLYGAGAAQSALTGANINPSGPPQAGAVPLQPGVGAGGPMGPGGAGAGVSVGGAGPGAPGAGQGAAL